MEHAEYSNPLADLAIARFDPFFIFGIEAMYSFTDQYKALSALDFTHLAYWDLFAALRAAPNLAAWSAGYTELGRPDITESTTREAHRLFTEQTFQALSFQ